MSVMRGVHIPLDDGPSYATPPPVRIVQRNRRAELGRLLDAYYYRRISHAELCASARRLCDGEGV